MTTATILLDTTYAAAPRETVGSATTAAPGPSGDGPQQRFADVLPLAQAALEAPAEKGKPGKEPAKDGASDEQPPAESSAPHGRPVRKKREATPEADGWLLASAVHPMMHRQAAAESGAAPVAKAASPSAKAAASPEMVPSSGQTIQRSATAPQTGNTREAASASPQASPTARAEPASVQAQKAQRTQQVPPVQQVQSTQQTQAAVAEQPDSVLVGTNVTVAAPPAQTVPAAKAPIQPALQGPQGTVPAAVAQTVSHGGQAGTAQASSGRTQTGPGGQVAHPASQGEGAESAVPLKSVPTPSAQAGVAEEKVGQGQVKPQAVDSPPTAGVQTPAGSEKMPQGQELAKDSPKDRTSKGSTTGPNEDLKVEAATVESRDTPLAGPKETGGTTPDVRVSSVAESGVVSSRPAVQAPSQTSTDVAPTRSPVQSVGEQILDSMQASATRGDRQILVRLQPPELGTVLVRFQEQGDQLTGTLEVSNRQTRREIEQALPQVIRALQEAGVQVRRVEVVTSDPSDRGPGGEHLPQDLGAQHQGTGQGRDSSQASPQMRWPRGAGEPNTARQRDIHDEPRASVPHGRIDLLL